MTNYTLCFLVCLSHCFWHMSVQWRGEPLTPGSGQGIQVGSVPCLSPWGCTVPWFQSGISGAHGIDLGLGAGLGRVSPRVIFLKSHQARQLPSEALCCLEQKTQALGHYLGPLHTVFSLISPQRLPPKYLRAGGKSEPPPKALTLLWRSFPAEISSLPPSCHCKEGTT